MLNEDEKIFGESMQYSKRGSQIYNQVVIGSQWPLLDSFLVIYIYIIGVEGTFMTWHWVRHHFHFCDV